MRMFSLAASRAPSSRFTLSRLLSALPRLITMHRERRALLRLDDHLLRDIGLTRETALREAARPVWDAPAAWRQ